MSYHLEVDDHEAQMELDRLIAMPTGKMSALLNGELAVTYAKTNAFTHRETGSLAASEKIVKGAPEPHQWEGALHFGGPSAPKDVDYAIYERARGGMHDFLQPAIDSVPDWVAAIKTGLGRGV